MLDPRAQLANHHVDQFDPFRVTNIDNYGTWGPWNFGPRARQTAQNYENYRKDNCDYDDEDEVVQFRPLNEQDDRSGVHSPPILSLSPASRTQAIARGQRELVDMVKNMPESCYELSLKDIVEQPKVEISQEECLFVAHQRVNNIKRQESKKNIEKKLNIVTTSTSMENGGLFLKMAFPISLKSKKKKNLNISTFSKVSPKPEISERTSDKDWWKKRFSASSESDSSGRSSSNNNGSCGSNGISSSCRSSSVRKKNGFFSSTCLLCFLSTKGKTAD